MRRCAILTHSLHRPEFESILEVAREHFDEVHELPLDSGNSDFDCYILDLQPDVLNGLEICRRILQVRPDSKVILVLDRHLSDKYHNQIGRSGTDFVCSTSEPSVLSEIMRSFDFGEGEA